MIINRRINSITIANAITATTKYLGAHQNQTLDVQLCIETTGPPIAMRVQATSTELDKLILNGTMKPISSLWASLIVVVKMKDGCYRSRGNYRLLNSVTEADKYQLLRIANVLDKAATSHIFSTIEY